MALNKSIPRISAPVAIISTDHLDVREKAVVQ